MGFFIGAMVEKGQTKAIAMDKQLSEKIELEKELKKLKIPQVLILSSGEVSAFQLILELKEQSEPVYYIEGEFTAPVNFRREPE